MVDKVTITPVLLSGAEVAIALTVRCYGHVKWNLEGRNITKVKIPFTPKEW